MATWYINDVAAALRGISGLRIDAQSQVVSHATFAMSIPFDQDAPYPYDSTVIIRKDAVRWFYGRVVPIPRRADPRFEGVSVVLADPWWYLDKVVYQQNWRTLVDGVVVPTQLCRIILGQDADGSRLTNGQVVQQVLDFAIAAGAPIQIGTIDPAIDIPLDEVQDLTCGEAIRRVLRWSPDAVTWFDHSTLPYPTFHCRKRANLTAVSSSVAGYPSQALSITARHDLVVPAVVLKYQTSSTVDELTYESTEIDKFPVDATGLEFGALVETMQIPGSQIGFISQRIHTEEIPANIGTNVNWWKAMVPALADAAISGLVLHDVVRPGDKKRYLLEGTIQDWMPKEAVEEIITAKVNYTRTDESGAELEIVDEPISVRLTTTDALSGTYRKLASYTEGEEIPHGLAQQIHAGASQLHYDGDVGLVESECLGIIRLGRVLNLTGGRTSWATMRALIQSVSYDIDTGRTSCSFGPATHLGAGDLVELLRANRRRGAAVSYLMRTTGLSGDSNGASLGGSGPKQDSSRGEGRTVKLVIANGDKKITLDPAELSRAEMHVVTLQVCVDGVAKSIQILATEPY